MTAATVTRETVLGIRRQLEDMGLSLTLTDDGEGLYVTPRERITAEARGLIIEYKEHLVDLLRITGGGPGTEKKNTTICELSELSELNTDPAPAGGSEKYISISELSELSELIPPEAPLTLVALIRHLRRRGITVRVNDDGTKLWAEPVDLIRADDAAAIRENKSALLAYLLPRELFRSSEVALRVEAMRRQAETVAVDAIPFLTWEQSSAWPEARQGPPERVGERCKSCGEPLADDPDWDAETRGGGSSWLRCSLCAEAARTVCLSLQVGPEDHCFCGLTVYRYGEDATPHCQGHAALLPAATVREMLAEVTP